jgi:hypothetical protein
VPGWSTASRAAPEAAHKHTAQVGSKRALAEDAAAAAAGLALHRLAHEPLARRARAAAPAPAPAAPPLVPLGRGGARVAASGAPGDALAALAALRAGARVAHVVVGERVVPPPLPLLLTGLVPPPVLIGHISSLPPY